MRFLLLLIALAAGFTSCKSEYAMLQDDLRQADGMRLQFYRPGTQDIMANYEIMERDTAEFALLRKAIAKPNADLGKCMPDGRIVYYKGGNIILETEFKMQPDCNSITFIYRNRLYLKKLSEETLTYLKEQDKELKGRFKQYEK